MIWVQNWKHYRKRSLISFHLLPSLICCFTPSKRKSLTTSDSWVEWPSIMGEDHMYEWFPPEHVARRLDAHKNMLIKAFLIFFLKVNFMFRNWITIQFWIQLLKTWKLEWWKPTWLPVLQSIAMVLKFHVLAMMCTPEKKRKGMR